MQAGRLKNRIAIQSVTDTRDSFTGAMTSSWATVVTRWAQVRPLSGNEQWQAGQANSEVTHEITFRYYSGLTPKNRLLFGARIFEITSVINTNEADKESVCLCTEIVR